MTSSALEWAMKELRSFWTIKKCLNNSTNSTQSFSASTFEKADDWTKRSITFTSKWEEKTVTLVKNNDTSYNVW